MLTIQSGHLQQRAERVMPGGVNSPVRSFRAVERPPLFVQSGHGAYIVDADGNRYIDYVLSWGPLLLGHAHPVIVRAIQSAAERGTSYGASTEIEVQMAETICAAFPGMDMVRMVNSGTEATMSALRLARGFTGRNKIVKFDGCYHGHADSLLVRAGSGALTHGTPNSPGVTKGTAEDTLIAPYNDLSAVEQLFKQQGEQIAAVIVEPVAGNMGLVPAMLEFLQGLRDITKRYGALLIFDEVITGFRLDYGGAQTKYGITPDLTCLGKIIGGGLPVGAYGGKREIMLHVSPSGEVYQAGTLSGNPLAMSAGLAMLEEIKKNPPYDVLEQRTSRLVSGLKTMLQEDSVPHTIHQVGSAFTLFFTEGPVTDLASAQQSDTSRYGAYCRNLLEAGIWVPPSQFETCFLSTAHNDEVIEETLTLLDRHRPWR